LITSALSIGAGGCGEKMSLLEAEGIPTASLYLEKAAWSLTDPVDVLQAAGRIFIIEGTVGTVTKYTTQQEVQFEVTGLVNPTALGLEEVGRRILVADEGGSGGPRILVYEQGDLSLVNSVDLTGIALSVSGIAANSQFVYASDPDSGVVHRFAWNGATLEAQGFVCTDQGSIESPQTISKPAGLAFDTEGMLLICDTDTLRNWVVRFDPAAPVDDATGLGTAVVFQLASCPNQPVEAFVLGRAPGCNEPFEPGPSSDPGGLYRPSGAAIDTDGRIYIADRNNSRAQRFTTDGVFDISFGDAGSDPLGEPTRIATWLGSTSRSGIPIVIPGARIYIVDRASNQVRVFEDKRWSDFQSEV